MRQEHERTGEFGEHAIFQRLRTIMRNAGLEALVALSPDNVTYTAGFLVPTHATNRFRRTISILAGDRFATQIVVGVEERLAKANSRFSDVRAYHQFREDPIDLLGEALTEAGVAGGRIGIELDYMPALDFVRLRERLPQAELVPCKDLYFSTRMIKTADEIATLRRVGELTERVIRDVAGEIRAGMTELDVAKLVVSGMLEGESTSFKYRVGSGPNSSIINCGTTSRQLSQGDIIRIEVLGDLENYRSNVTRTLVLGTPTLDQRRLFERLVSARRDCEVAIHPGAPVAAVYKRYLENCRSGGIEPSITFLGHGIGLTVHEEPYITAERETVFEENMTFTMEPLHVVPGEFGLHVEDMFVVTRSGFERITGDGFDGDSLIEVG
jgi:Xaa-Pro aminopeptidase